MSDIPVPGVRAIDHTADIALEIEAPDLAGLLSRAALGLAWLLTEAPPPDVSGERHADIEAPAAPDLLRAWLREILAWHDAEGLVPAAVRVDEALEGRVSATIHVGVPDSDPVREIKGVTYHDLAAEPRGEGWWGRVVFDV